MPSVISQKNMWQLAYKLQSILHVNIHVARRVLSNNPKLRDMLSGRKDVSADDIMSFVGAEDVSLIKGDKKLRRSNGKVSHSVESPDEKLYVDVANLMRRYGVDAVVKAAGVVGTLRRGDDGTH